MFDKGVIKLIPKGVFYFWLARTYPWGDIGRSITQWVYVGLNAKICPSGKTAFVARITNIQKQPWGYTCRSSKNFSELNMKKISVDEQLALIKNSVKNQDQLHELAKHLRPLEKHNYWSDELQALLEEYLKIEEMVFQEGLKRKCEWLIKFIKERDINLKNEGMKFTIESYGRTRDKRVRVKVPTRFKNPETEWVIRRVSIKPKDRRLTRRIQPKDVELYYPVFKVLIENINHLVESLGLSTAISERWGSL